MERKYKVNESVTEDSSANGAQSKEVALEKLRKMEWKRNSQDSWHLARSNARGADFQERKKYNKDEDNYFEGTSVQKNKKMRRPRVSEGRPSAVPQGFSVAEPSPAPQVNAWAKKKGSELFQKEEEVDEEDQVMKLVLEESLKSVEEDNKRRMERLRMANRDLQASSSKTMPAERDWEEEYETEDYNVKHSLGGNKDYTPKPDLVFVDTDDIEENANQNQRHRSIPPRNRNTSPQEKSTPHFKNQKFDYPDSDSKVPPAVNKTRSSGENEASSTRVNKEPDDNYFEPPHHQGRDSKPVDKGNEITRSSPQATHSSSTLVNSSFNQANFNADNLATSFNSTLTFGDTQGLLEKIQGDDSLKIRGNIPGFRTETPSTGSSEMKPVNPASEPSETDILLHNFIRHEPPTNTISLDQSDVLGMTAVDKSEPNDLFALQTSQAYSQNITSAQGSLPQQMVSSEQLSAVNGLVGISLPGGVQVPNGRDASSSVSGSPLQNITPYGSLENQIHSSVNTGGQAASLLGNVPYQYPSYTIENQESLARHLQAMQLINQNLTSPMNREYSAIPTAVRGMMPVHSQGQPQIRLTNSNMMIPPYQGMSPMLLQHHLQQAQLQQAQLQQAQLQQAQLQQAHLQQMQIPPGYLPHVMADATQLQQSQNSPDAAESDNDEDDATDEQVNVNHPRTQNHNQMVTQNQTQIPQNQVQIPQNQSQIPQAQSQVPLHNLQAQAQISIHNPQAQAGLQTQMLPQAPYGQIFSQTQAQLLLQAQAQMLSQNNAQMLSQTNTQMLSQNQQLFHLQNHPQPGTEMSTPKQEELLQQQAMLGRTQGVKTAEELHQQKMKALQVLMQTEEEIQRQNALSQTTLPTAQPQPGWGMIPQSPQMPLSVNQFFPVGMVPQVHPHLMQQTQNASVMPPTVQPTVQNQINAGLMNTGSESFPAQEPAQPAVGRGRGRIL